jgi:aminocarboxymuconate-semialdehyde decarboxylase
MRIIDSHFHWWPRSIFDQLCGRKGYPRADRNARGGYDYWRRQEAGAHLNSWAEWFDLDEQFAHMDGLGHQVDVVCSIGPTIPFDLPAEEGRDAP